MAFLQTNRALRALGSRSSGIYTSFCAVDPAPIAFSKANPEVDYLQRILTSRVYDVAIETPLDEACTLSGVLNSRILFKREDLQPVFSFKIRGAYNKIISLSEEEQRRGVVCCSAGNHAQGVALSAKMLKINAKIVMPEGTPAIKVDATRNHGGEYGEVILHGLSYDEAAAEANR
jgi:threonine dehydratase